MRLGAFAAISLLLVACGGGLPAAPAVPAPAPIAKAPEPPKAEKAEKEPTCKEALNASHAKADALCSPVCDGGDATICLALAVHHTADPKGAKVVEGYLEKACEKGLAEACLKLYELLEQDAPDRALSAVEKGCAADPADAMKRSCRAAGSLRGRSGKVEDLRAALASFDRGCQASDALACAEKRRTERAIEEAEAPTPIEGKLLSATGGTVKVKVSSKEPLTQGADVDFQRHFESKPGQRNALGVLGSIFGGTVTGWVGIAKARVSKIDGDVVTLTVVEERSVIKVNGKKVNHFTPGAKVRILAAKATR
ncbi:MAG: sel1 repeat family protein [Labilithrix sp.]|nr:sel1 repeat family protein [Labilithrix sp.]